MSTLHICMAAALLFAPLSVASQDQGGDQQTREQQERREQRQLPDKRIVQMMLEALTAEAETAAEAGRMEHAEPDFAARFAEEHPDLNPSEESILQAILQRQDRDPFTDAYIRWQLTSFDPDLPEIDTRILGRIIEQAPPMVENPRAAPGVLNTMRRAEASGRLPQETTAQLREALADLEDRTMIAEELNRPAIEWRDWVSEKLGTTGILPRLWLLERLRARIRAGWDARTLKGNISRNFSDSINDETFTARDRRVVLEMIRQLERGVKREYLGDVTFYANGTLKLTIHRIEVSGANVDTWHRRLLGIE